MSKSKRLFGSEVSSVVLSRIYEECSQVIFAIASQNSMHFHLEMDKLLLDQLKQLLDHLLLKL